MANQKNNQLGVWILLIGGGLWYLNSQKDTGTTTEAPARSIGTSSSPAYQAAAIPPAAPALALPPQERNFIAVVTKAREAYAAGQNDMAKGASRPARARELCAAMPSPIVNDWIGTIKTLSSNSDGDGVLGVEIAKNIMLKTWNNSFSDISTRTLIKSHTPMFQKAASLSIGTRVKFSGTLFKADVDCFNESSLSMSGSMREPEFIFRFASVEAL